MPSTSTSPAGTITSMRSGAHFDRSERQTALVLRLINEVWNQRNFRVVDEIVHPEFRRHDPIVVMPITREILKQYIQLFHFMVPGTSLDVIEIASEQDVVVACVAVSGPIFHQMYRPIPGLQILDNRVTGRYRIQDDLIIESWIYLSALDLKTLLPRYR
jgi:hypothetical protein